MDGYKSMPKQQVIAVDLDDVIVETAPKVLDHYFETYKTRVSLEQFYSRDYQGVWNAPDRITAVRRVNKFLESPEYHQSGPIDEAIETLRWLKNRHELHIVTGRPSFVEAATREWLKKNATDLFETVVFTNYFMSGENNEVRTKGEICTELGATVLIDDNLEHIMDAAKAGVNGLLFGSYPWNKTDELPKNVRRVSGWVEVKEYFDGRG